MEESQKQKLKESANEFMEQLFTIANFDPNEHEYEKTIKRAREEAETHFAFSW